MTRPAPQAEAVPNMASPEEITQRQLEALAEITSGLDRRLEHAERTIGRDGEELRRIVAEGTAEGLHETITDPELWRKVRHETVGDPEFWRDVRMAMMTQTRHAAGSWLLQGMATGLKALAWGAIVGMGLYLLGGWKLLVAVASTFAAGSNSQQ